VHVQLNRTDFVKSAQICYLYLPQQLNIDVTCDVMQSQCDVTNCFLSIDGIINALAIATRCGLRLQSRSSSSATLQKYVCYVQSAGVDIKLYWQGQTL